MKEDIIRKPVELIDEDLDAEAGGDFNIADVDVKQYITQAQAIVYGFYNDQDQSAANVSSVSQSNS